jgi:hypothetical protein
MHGLARFYHVELANYWTHAFFVPVDKPLVPNLDHAKQPREIFSSKTISCMQRKPEISIYFPKILL